MFEIVQDQVGCQVGWEVVTGIIENCRQCVINGNQVENDSDSSKSSDALDLAKSTSVLLEDKNLLGVSGPFEKICLPLQIVSMLSMIFHGCAPGG